MPIDRPTVYQVTQLSPETVAGTPVAASKRLLDLQTVARPNDPVPVYRPMGSRAPTTSLAQKSWVSGQITGEIGYQSLAYILSSLFLTVSPSTPSGATAQRLWSFKPSTFAPDVYKTYTMEQGSSAGAESWAYAFINTMGLTFNRTTAGLTADIMAQRMNEQITMTGSPTDIPALPVDPRAPTLYMGSSTTTNKVTTLAIAGATGTYVLTFDGLSTGAIAVGASTATVQAALQGLANIGANNVTVTGTPGTSYTITWTGALAGVDVSLLTISGFTGGPPTITNTTPGGLTKLTRASSFGLTIPAVYQEQFTLNASDPSFSYLVQIGLEPTASLVLEHDSAAAAFMTDLRARTTKYLRLVAFGSAVETLSSIPYLNAMVLTMPFRFTESDRSDVDGAWSSTYTLGSLYDSTFAGFIQVDLYNGLSAL